MGLKQGIFAVKLCELEREYGRLQSRIHLLQAKEPTQVQEELERLLDEYRERKYLLDERVQASRSPVVAALAQAQLEFAAHAEQILTDDLPNEMRVRNQSDAEDRAEAMSLYAEYAIDFATQAMRYALIASLSAIVLQQKAEHKTTLEEQKGDLT